MTERLVACLVLVAALASRAAADDRATLLDGKAKLEARIAALDALTAQQLHGEGDPLRAVLAPLLEDLGRRAAEPALAPLAVRALRATNPLRPFPDLGRLARPFLDARAPIDVRGTALLAIALHGATGLAAPLRELAGRGDGLEHLVVAAGRALPEQEAAQVLEASLERARERGARRAAATALGELGGSVGLPALSRASLATAPDEELACAAALALERRGSLTGVGELVKRLSNGAGVATYRAVCAAANRSEGFAGLAPARWNVVRPEERSRVIAAVEDWWAKAKDRTPDDLLLETLAARKIRVAGDANSKAAVVTLLDALALDDPLLRNKAVRLLALRTDRRDLLEQFRTIVTSCDGHAVSESAPPGGFPDPARRAALREQELRTAAAWRQWWAEVSPRATLVRGVWKVR